jgi:hypothetical protein
MILVSTKVKNQKVIDQQQEGSDTMNQLATVVKRNPFMLAV